MKRYLEKLHEGIQSTRVFGWMFLILIPAWIADVFYLIFHWKVAGVITTIGALTFALAYSWVNRRNSFYWKSIGVAIIVGVLLSVALRII